MNKKVISKKLTLVVEKKNQTPAKEDDIVRFYLCLIFYCFLFTNTQCHMRKGLLRYIENLGSLHNFNWVEVILKCTLEKISHCQ